MKHVAALSMCEREEEVIGRRKGNEEGGREGEGGRSVEGRHKERAIE